MACLTTETASMCGRNKQSKTFSINQRVKRVFKHFVNLSFSRFYLLQNGGGGGGGGGGAEF